MARGIPLRDDFTGDDLRRLARTSDNAKQARRPLALSLAYDGGTRTQAAARQAVTKGAGHRCVIEQIDNLQEEPATSSA